MVKNGVYSLELESLHAFSEIPTLFTKWDRFSRNTGDSYQMINKLRDLGVEPEAIEQPLNVEIPENKLMLALSWPYNLQIRLLYYRKAERCCRNSPLSYSTDSENNG